jgi:hypothetical protein
MTKHKQKPAEDFMTSKWRPMMAIMYMCVCLCDFILFPIGFTAVQFWETAIQNDAFRQWQPMTLQGGGLFHMAMGAVLGITAWSRGQEKMAGVTQTTQNYSALALPQNYADQYQQTSFPQSGFNGTSAQDFQPVRTGYGGKLAPPQYPQPLI